MMKILRPWHESVGLRIQIGFCSSCNPRTALTSVGTRWAADSSWKEGIDRIMAGTHAAEVAKERVLLGDA